MKSPLTHFQAHGQAALDRLHAQLIDTGWTFKRVDTRRRVERALYMRDTERMVVTAEHAGLAGWKHYLAGNSDYINAGFGR